MSQFIKRIVNGMEDARHVEGMNRYFEVRPTYPPGTTGEDDQEVNGKPYIPSVVFHFGIDEEPYISIWQNDDDGPVNVPMSCVLEMAEMMEHVFEEYILDRDRRNRERKEFIRERTETE